MSLWLFQQQVKEKCIDRLSCMQRLIESMDNASIAVLVYPTWSNPPLLIGDYGSPDGELHS